MMKMDQSTWAKQQKVIDDLSDEDFKRLKDLNPKELFAWLSDEQKGPFLESLVDLVGKCMEERNKRRHHIDYTHHFAQVSIIVFIISMCLYMSF